MNRVVFGVVAGAAAAAFFGASAAHADTTWTPDYDVKGAELFAGAPTTLSGEPSSAWELPASFTSSTGTTLSGTDYILSGPGGFNDEFVTGGGAIYDQDQLGGGFTNLYYDPSATGVAVDVMKTPFGDIDLSSIASAFAPQDFETVTGPAAIYGENTVITDRTSSYLAEALGLVNNHVGWEWSGGPTEQSVITAMQTPDSSLVWSVPATFTQGIGPDTTTLTGTEYVTSLNDVEFVTNSGAVFEWERLSSGFLFMDNLYYAPANGPAQDLLETVFGTFDLSSIASWLAPADVSDLVTAAPLTDLQYAGLCSALDLGLPSAGVADLVDPLGWLGL